MLAHMDQESKLQPAFLIQCLWDYHLGIASMSASGTVVRSASTTWLTAPVERVSFPDVGDGGPTG